MKRIPATFAVLVILFPLASPSFAVWPYSPPPVMPARVRISYKAAATFETQFPPRRGQSRLYSVGVGGASEPG
jgi:hypothetical protein